MRVLILFTLVSLALGDKVPSSGREVRRGKQNGLDVQGGVDFSSCQNDLESGLCCVEKEETVKSLQKDPILECTHKSVEKCHYTYITQFYPAQEEVCEENFEKICQITFKQQAFNETVKKCYKPLEKVCNGQGPQQCRTLFESSCTTKYIEKQPGKFVGDTKCEKLPVEICGAGCTTEEGPEECHDKVITSLIDVPEETCDLNPQQTCRFQTKLVPRLKPVAECTTIPKEVCNLKFTQPQEIEKPLKTKWCLDPSAAEPGEQYEESSAFGAPLGSSSNEAPFFSSNIAIQEVSRPQKQNNQPQKQKPKSKPKPQQTQAARPQQTQAARPQQQPAFQPQQPAFQPEQPAFQPQPAFAPSQQTFQPQGQTFQPQSTFQSQPQSFQPQGQTFQPQQPAFQSQAPLASYGG